MGNMVECQSMGEAISIAKKEGASRMSVFFTRSPHGKLEHFSVSFFAPPEEDPSPDTFLEVAHWSIGMEVFRPLRRPFAKRNILSCSDLIMKGGYGALHDL